MSSRQLRKLQQQRELERQAQLQEEVEEESEDEPIPQKPQGNTFSFAALEDGAGDDDNEEDEEEQAKAKDEDEGNANRHAEELSDHEPTPPLGAKKPKKSKKKKGKKGKGKDKEKQAEPKAHTLGADEIDAALRELNLKPRSKGTSAEPVIQVDQEYERVCQLLSVTSQHLKVANEMRTLFGKTALENHDDAGGPVPRAGRRQRERAQHQQMDLETALKGRHEPGKGLPEVTLRRNCFIQGKDEWPKATTGGLTMAVVDDRSTDGTMEFRFVHDRSYIAVQTQFHGYVEMGDPQQLIGLLIQHPYHISLLTQVSKIAKDQTDHALSSDLLERALFTFGRACTSVFQTKLAAGKARLDFSRPENRELWVAGYHYIKSLVMKGTYRTALEWAKCLLSLDPEGDPYCMRLMIHHLALRAHQSQWLLDTSNSILNGIWNVHGLEMQAGKHLSPSNAYAALLLGEATQSRDLLTQSMRTVPWLFTRLFSEINLDAPPSIWGIKPRTDAETLFTELYVLETKSLWGTPEATALLMEIAHTIPKGSINVDDIPKTENEEMTLDIVRFVYLENNPVTMRLVPSLLLHKPNNSDFDPIPPAENTYSYELQQAVLQRGMGDGMGGPGGDFDQFFNPIQALANLIPQFRDAGGNAEDLMREAMRVAAEEHDGDEDEPADENPRTEGIVRRLLDTVNMLWSGGGGRMPGTGPEDTDQGEWLDEDDSEIDTDTDEEMPGLLGENGEVETDSDEMPGLIGEDGVVINDDLSDEGIPDMEGDL